MASLNFFVVLKGDLKPEGFSITDSAVIEAIAPRSLPATISSVGVLSAWTIPPEDLGKVVSNASLEVLRPGESDSFIVNFQICDQPIFKALQSLRGLQLQRPGPLVLRMFLEGHFCQEKQIQILPPEQNCDDRNLLEYNQDSK